MDTTNGEGRRQTTRNTNKLKIYEFWNDEFAANAQGRGGERNLSQKDVHMKGKQQQASKQASKQQAQES